MNFVLTFLLAEEVVEPDLELLLVVEDDREEVVHGDHVDDELVFFRLAFLQKKRAMSDRISTVDRFTLLPDKW